MCVCVYIFYNISVIYICISIYIHILYILYIYILYIYIKLKLFGVQKSRFFGLPSLLVLEHKIAKKWRGMKTMLKILHTIRVAIEE